MTKYERPSYAELCSAQMSIRDWARVYWGEQTWRGMTLDLEVWLRDDQRLEWFGHSEAAPFRVFAGIREFIRLAWDDDADGWYEREAARLAEQAPA